MENLFHQEPDAFYTGQTTVLRASLKAPFGQLSIRLPPWHGGPAPSKTRPTWENLCAQLFTISRVTSCTQLTAIIFGNRDSTTLGQLLKSPHSTLTWPWTFQPKASTATLKAPIPSKSPIVSGDFHNNTHARTNSKTSVQWKKSQIEAAIATKQTSGCTRCDTIRYLDLDLLGTNIALLLYYPHIEHHKPVALTFWGLDMFVPPKCRA